VYTTLFLFHPAKNKQLSTLKNFYAELLMLRQNKLERFVITAKLFYLPMLNQHEIACQ